MGVGEKPGLSGAAIFDFYIDPREEAARCCQRSLRTECSMSGRFAMLYARREIAGRRQGEQLAAREWPVLALHSLRPSRDHIAQ